MAAGLSPNQTESILKTGQQLWETSPAGRRFSLLKSVLPTIVSYQGAAELRGIEEDLKEGRRLAAVKRGSAIQLSPELKSTFKVDTYGDLINAFGDDTPRILDFYATTDYRKELARLRGDQATFQKLSKLKDQHDDIGKTIANLRAKLITEEDIAELYKQGYTEDKVKSTIYYWTITDGRHMATKEEMDVLRGQTAILRSLRKELGWTDLPESSETPVVDAAELLKKLEERRAPKPNASANFPKFEDIYGYGGGL